MAPKHPSARHNRTKASTKAEITRRDDELTEVPAPPDRREIQHYKSKDGKKLSRRIKREWHENALETWREIQESPMLDEFIEADFGALRQLLALESDFWERIENPDHPNASLVSAEITRIRKNFGLMPMGRRSMQKTIAETGNQMANLRKKMPPKAIDAKSIDLPDAAELAASLED